MTCSNAQDSVMLYHEKRLKSLASLALHRHINKCEDCREFFLAMDAATRAGNFEAETEPAEDFIEVVMAKIYELPAYAPLPSETPPKAKSSNDWIRVAGCLYALVLAAGLALFFNTDLIEIPYSNIETGAWADAFFGSLIQAGQYATTAALSSGIANPTLAITIILGSTLLFMLQREKVFSKKHE